MECGSDEMLPRKHKLLQFDQKFKTRYCEEFHGMKKQLLNQVN